MNSVDIGTLVEQMKAMPQFVSTGTCACGGELFSEKKECDDCVEDRRKLNYLFDRWRLFECPREYIDAWFGHPEIAKRVRDHRALEQGKNLGADFRVLTLQGKAGIGKTTLGCAVAVAWIKVERKLPMFVSAFALASARSEARLGSEPDLICKARTAPLLILDDLGNERLTESSDVVPIVFARHEKQLPTIYTISGSRVDIGTRYGDGVGRRLFERSTVMEMAASALRVAMPGKAAA